MEEKWRKIKRNHEFPFLDKLHSISKHVLHIYISYRMQFIRISLNCEQPSYVLKEHPSYSDTVVFSIREIGKLLS